MINIGKNNVDNWRIRRSVTNYIWIITENLASERIFFSDVLHFMIVFRLRINRCILAIPQVQCECSKKYEIEDSGAGKIRANFLVSKVFPEISTADRT